MARTTRSTAPADTAPRLAEIGVSGIKVNSGYLDEEFLPDLRGARGRRKLREMADNDPTIGAILSAITLVIRAVSWDFKPNEHATDAGQAEAEAEFAESLFDDMSHTFEEFLGEMIWGELVYGFAPHEIVLKVRQGPDQKDPSKRSAYADGRIGIRKLPLRSQDTVERWDMQEDGGIAGLWQQPPNGGAQIFIPIERLLLFRTVSRKNSPEGVSILRNAYKPWYFLNKIQEVEAIGIERELAGLPVMYVPSKILTSTAPADVAIRQRCETIVSRVRNNSQGGLLLSSDTYADKDGSPTTVRKQILELVKTGGPRAIDTNATIARYQRDIARSVLADFLLLGSDGKGSYALSDNKSSLFYRAIETILWDAAAVINRHLLPRLWAVNGLPRDTMPEAAPGRLAGIDLGAMGEFIQRMAAAGAPIFPDDELENRLREEADLPPKSDEAKALQAGALNPPRLAPPAAQDGADAGDNEDAGAQE